MVRQGAEPNGDKIMSKLDAMHIEFLNEMVNHKNQEWAEAAYQELQELKAYYAGKGIIIL